MPRKHKPVHPGKILWHEFMEPLGITRYRLAKETGMPRDRAGKLVSGERGITADTALRLARFFGTSPEFWMNLQARFDLPQASAQRRAPLDRGNGP